MALDMSACMHERVWGAKITKINRRLLILLSPLSSQPPPLLVITRRSAKATTGKERTSGATRGGSSSISQAHANLVQTRLGNRREQPPTRIMAAHGIKERIKACSHEVSISGAYTGAREHQMQKLRRELSAHSERGLRRKGAVADKRKKGYTTEARQ